MRVGAEYYDRDYFETAGCKGWYDATAFALDNPFHRDWANLCREVLGICSAERVLDVGCARGNVVHWLREEGVNAFGLDLSAWAVANSHVPDRVRCRDLAADDLFQPDGGNLLDWRGTFEHVISRETFEHLHPSQVDVAVANVRGLLRPGGRFLIAAATNRYGKEDRKQAEGSASRDPSHQTVRDLYWWCERFEAAGAVVDWRRTVYASNRPPLAYRWGWDIVVGCR